MIYALHTLNQNGIVHRDIKPENFLISKDCEIKLIDFGYSRKLKSLNERMSCVLGTPGYLAPEVKSKNYSYKCDWFSLGMTIWMIMTGFQYQRKEIDSSMLHYLDVLRSESAKKLIKDLLNSEKRRLSSLEEAKDHPFFFNFNWDYIEEINKRKN